MKKLVQIIIGVMLVLVLSFVLYSFFGEKTVKDVDEDRNVANTITSFSECVEAGFPVQEKYPRVCVDNKGNSFEEFIANLTVTGKEDLIVLESPLPNTTVGNPIEIKGRARGTWFFEGDFPVVVVNWDGLIIGEGFATAQGEWMTEDFVPFIGTIDYDLDPETYSRKGALILQKDNPSGLPQHDDALEVPIVFE
jgi:hypothetical protein